MWCAFAPTLRAIRTSPHLTSPHLTSPHLISPHLTSPHLTSSHLIPSHTAHAPYLAIPMAHKLPLPIAHVSGPCRTNGKHAIMTHAVLPRVCLVFTTHHTTMPWPRPAWLRHPFFSQRKIWTRGYRRFALWPPPPAVAAAAAAAELTTALEVVVVVTRTATLVFMMHARGAAAAAVAGLATMSTGIQWWWDPVTTPPPLPPPPRPSGALLSVLPARL
jgi:hypothetical protein